MLRRVTCFLICLCLIEGLYTSHIFAQIQTPPPTSSFSRNLAIPDQGTDVSALQQVLISQGFLSIQEPTGHFGPQTYGALINWQTSVGLPGTGYFGPASRAAIQNTNPVVPVTSVPVSQVVVPPSTGGVSTYTRDLSTGDTGPDVVLLQNLLITKGLLPPTKPTGFFGPLTKVAVQRWQALNGVPNTGYVGPRTRATLASPVVATIATTADTTTTDKTITNPVTPIVGAPISVGTGFSGGGGGGGTPPASPVSTPVVPVIPERPDQIPPSIPAHLTGTTVSTSSIALAWSSSVDNVAVRGYKVFRRGIQIATTTAPAFRDTGLTAATSYTYNISAFDTVFNNSSFSSSVSITTASPATTTTPGTPAPIVISHPPTVPQRFIVTSVSSSSISLAWDSSSEQGGRISGYTIFRNSAEIGRVVATTFTDKTLRANTSYGYSIVSYDALGVSSGFSTTVSTTTLSSPGSVPPPPPPPPPPPSTVNYNFGVSTNNSVLSLDSVKMNQYLDALVSLGVGWLRFDMQWRAIQPRNDTTYFDWVNTDRLVAAASAHHIKILAILGYSATWADLSACPPNTHCPPADPALFAAYARAVVERYSPQGVSTWEVWNEPNNAIFWGPKTSCSAYTALLKVTYSAIKQADSHATVVTGGLAPEATDGTNISPTDFLKCIYDNGGKDSFDAVGDHPYTFPQLPSAGTPHAWAQMSSTNPSLRSIMVAHGDTAKKIWLTEFGAPTNGPDPKWFVSEGTQTTMVSDAVYLYKGYNWAGPLFWYTLKDGGTSTNTIENFFGLTHVDGTPKPAYTSLKNALR